MKDPVSVWIDYYKEFPVEQAIEKLSAAGFTHGELSDLHLDQIMARGNPAATGKAIKAHADTLGYTIPQGHLSYKYGLVDDSALERLKPELELFAAMGIEKAVLHVSGGTELEEAARYAAFVENLRRLSVYVEGSGITLCLENLMSTAPTRTAQGLLKLIDDSGGKNMGICLDTGHLHFCNKQGLASQSQGDFIRTAGSKLLALHINDNNGLGDTHQMPFSARYGIDWKEVMQSLRDVNYKGLFNLELVGESGGTPAIKRAKLDFIRAMCDYMRSDAFPNA